MEAEGFFRVQISSPVFLRSSVFELTECGHGHRSMQIASVFYLTRFPESSWHTFGREIFFAYQLSAGGDARIFWIMHAFISVSNLKNEKNINNNEYVCDIQPVGGGGGYAFAGKIAVDSSLAGCI